MNSTLFFLQAYILYIAVLIRDNILILIITIDDQITIAFIVQQTKTKMLPSLKKEEEKISKQTCPLISILKEIMSLSKSVDKKKNNTSQCASLIKTLIKY